MTNVSANSRVAIRAESLIAAHYLDQILKSRSARVRSDWRKQVEGEWDEWKNCAAPVAARRSGHGGRPEPSDVLAVQLSGVQQLQQPEPDRGARVLDRPGRRVA